MIATTGSWEAVSRSSARTALGSTSAGEPYSRSATAWDSSWRVTARTTAVTSAVVDISTTVRAVGAAPSTRASGGAVPSATS